MTTITELKYSNTNTYLIESGGTVLLFDTGWAGTFPAFCKAMGDHSKRVQDIDYILVSHFHPDHMGIAQEIADLGATILVVDVQKDFIHSSDAIFAKTPNVTFRPIDDEKVKTISVKESRIFLNELGILGEILHTPGHSDDSVSLYLDEGMLFVGDLNPLYELELHKGTEIEASWIRLLALEPKKVYYGHAKTAELGETQSLESNDTQSENARLGITQPQSDARLYQLVSRIMRYIDKGYSIEKIQKKTSADVTFIEDVNRMYLTHQNVGVQGILDRIEIKNK